MLECRLEALARKKFWDEGINECKELVRKLLATVPESVYEFINLKRKEKMRWTDERLMWNNILVIVEDYELDKCMEESRSVSVRTQVAEIIPEFKRYRKAVLEGLRRMAERVVDRSVRASSVNVVSPKRDRSASVGRIGSVSCEREQQCYRCGKPGHKKNECRWMLGACFRCGQMGHLMSEYKKDRSVKCYRRGQIGHIANGCRGTRVNDVCGNCGESGHYAKMCKEPCVKCVEFGMTADLSANAFVGRKPVHTKKWRGYGFESLADLS
ncbi:uncharacterized protein LOC135216523 [Macrobrachium nipponense]|uniref:uncharacterized protein LOC135216523 n=1 Tax=Macrobrachium nipponense TaxID=159736 RepID=UPI0030C7F6EC